MKRRRMERLKRREIDRSVSALGGESGDSKGGPPLTVTESDFSRVAKKRTQAHTSTVLSLRFPLLSARLPHAPLPHRSLAPSLLSEDQAVACLALLCGLKLG